jgi:hypothetical protein
MRSALRLIPLVALLGAALAACGIARKPEAGTPHVDHAPGSHAQIDDPRTKHVRCLRANGLPVQLFRAAGQRPAIQIGTLPSGPTVVFEPTPGDAQGEQITGHAPGAEVIGSALLYPHGASDAELSKIETCVAVGVTG